MDDDNFYVTLPSTASSGMFEENTQSNYITVMNPPIMLTDEWVVGLTEIHLPRKVYNVSSENNKFEVAFTEVGRYEVVQTVFKDGFKPQPSGHLSEPFEVYAPDGTGIPLVIKPVDYNDMLAFELDIDPNVAYTRENYMTTMQKALESLKDQVRGGITFTNDVRIEDVQLQTDGELRYMYDIKFENDWKMLYNADDIENCHIQLARLFGVLPETFFQPKERGMLINKYDSLDGEREEFKVRLRPHTIYIYNTRSVIPSELFEARVKKVTSMHTKDQICSIPEGAYMTPEVLVKAVSEALPKQMDHFFSLSTTAAGHLKIISFNHKHYSIMFPTSDGNTLGQMLGVPIRDLDIRLPEKPIIHDMDGQQIHFEDPDEWQVGNLIRIEDLPEKFILDSDEVEPSKTHGKSPYDLGYSAMGNYIAKYPIDVYAGVYGLYVYCDIVAPGYTGNTQANLLRVLPTNVDNISVFNYSNQPHYKPVSVKYITKIQIVIKTDTGYDVMFSTESKTLCKLHFKKKIRE